MKTWLEHIAEARSGQDDPAWREYALYCQQRQQERQEEVAEVESVLTHAGALTLERLARELASQQETKLDYVADTRRAGFFDTDSGAFAVTLDGVDGEFVVNKLAHEHIGAYAGIPKRYYDRMKDGGEGERRLLRANVEHWLIADPGKRMFRTLAGELRAVLSDRYRRLDNYDLAQHLLPEFETVPGLEFMVAALTPEKMYLRATLPTLQREVRVGDWVQAGVEIGNSEVGSGALYVRPYVLRLDCVNGMTSKIAIRKYHSGGRIEESEEALQVFSDETRAADDKVIFMKAADLVRASLTEVQFEAIVAGLKEIANSEQIVAPVAAVEVLGKQLELGEDEQQTVLQFLATGGDLTQWGMVNALTETAKSADTFDRLVEIESKAGELSTMGAQEWSRVALAA